MVLVQRARGKLCETHISSLLRPGPGFRGVEHTVKVPGRTSRSGRTTGAAPRGALGSTSVDWAVLGELDETERRLVLQRAVRRRFRKGDTLFFEGDPGDTLHLLAKGKVAVRVSTPMGETATLSVLGPGSCFGEQALLSGQGTRTATVVALEATETMAIQRATFEEIRSQHPAVERFLVQLLAAQVRRLSTGMLEALYLPADTRVLRRLLDTAAVYNDGSRPIRIPLTQEDLATMAGTTRPTANRALQQLEAAGHVQLGRGRVDIVDLDALARAAS